MTTPQVIYQIDRGNRDVRPASITGAGAERHPRRIQQRRVRGWKLPENAVSVARPSRWGNPFRVSTIDLNLYLSARGEYLKDPLAQVWRASTRKGLKVNDLAVMASVDLYRRLCERFALIDPEGYSAWLAPLRGKDLACFCPLTYDDGRHHPCHADVLLALANA